MYYTDHIMHTDHTIRIKLDQTKHQQQPLMESSKLTSMVKTAKISEDVLNANNGSTQQQQHGENNHKTKKKAQCERIVERYSTYERDGNVQPGRGAFLNFK